MCGIFGVITFGPSEVDTDRARLAGRTLIHRGPDDSGFWSDGRSVALAHQRLSIIDVSDASHQPFRSECGRYALIYNGEIYNYVELRKELEALGAKFRTAGDTEVVLASYAIWGGDCVKHFNGDWAFAIYDSQSKELFCSRDRFGVKPLVYAQLGNMLIFASECKAILAYSPKLRRPNYDAIANYVRHGLGAQLEATWFEGIVRLQPAHNLRCTNGRVSVSRYWQYPANKFAISLSDAEHEYRRLFARAVQLRMRSDVPVGTTLSSGLDSSSIAAIASGCSSEQHQTFTVLPNDCEFTRGEKNVYRDAVVVDERGGVEEIVQRFGLKAHYIPAVNEDLVDVLARVTYHLESGHSSPATVAVYKLMQLASKHVKVVLEGQGADELLGGYILNILPNVLWNHLRAGRLPSAYNELSAFRRNYSALYSAKMAIRLMNLRPVEAAYQRWTGINRLFLGPLSSYVRAAEFPLDLPPQGDAVSDALVRSHAGGLVNLLHYGDALSMAASVESRAPFMDVDLVEFAGQLPVSMLYRNGYGKFIHRRAMEGMLPNSIVWNRLKFGFNTPVARSFLPGACGLETLLSSNRGIFDVGIIERMAGEQARGGRDVSTLLFRLLATELWFRTFIDKTS